jgi:hypothetical protein
VIRITLHNTGDNAYHPELYGNSIIVERLIKANGQ